MRAAPAWMPRDVAPACRPSVRSMDDPGAAGTGKRARSGRRPGLLGGTQVHLDPPILLPAFGCAAVRHRFVFALALVTERQGQAALPQRRAQGTADGAGPVRGQRLLGFRIARTVPVPNQHDPGPWFRRVLRELADKALNVGRVVRSKRRVPPTESVEHQPGLFGILGLSRLRSFEFFAPPGFPE